MDERSVLTAQIHTLHQRLSRAKDTLRLPQIDVDLRERVLVRFDVSIRKQQQALRGVQEGLERELALAGCWDRFRDIQRDCEPLFQECLALVEGALTRTAGLDNGLCQIADTLLSHLSDRSGIPWGRFTIVAENEFFANMAQIIRMRYAEETIWNLPVVGHEFGHFVGPKLEVYGADGRSRYPFQALLERERQRGLKYWSLMHEHFADLFATYALGPAYAYTCILLRFDPGTAYSEGSGHPSAAKRVYFILNVLEKMDQAQEGVVRPYQDIIEELRGLWRQALEATRQPESLELAVIMELTNLLNELYSLIDTELPYVQYGGWLRAQRLAYELEPDNDTGPTLQNADTLPDVLNAAWLSRIRHWDKNDYVTRGIADKAVLLCREIDHGS
jgi:hypothetical protein